MAIRRSSSADVDRLIAELRSPAVSDSRREAALARLTVIGSRAVARLLTAFGSATTTHERRALLSALERIPDLRSIDAVLATIGPSNQGAGEATLQVRAAAIRAARPLLTLAPQRTAVLERLTVLALDAGEPLPLRRAALDALDDLPPRTTALIRERLLEDPDPAVRALVGGEGGDTPATKDAAPDLLLSDDPILALDSVARVSRTAPLTVLHALLAPVREREAAGGRRRPDWTAVRGAIHVALARRDSRVGLYDLREAFEHETLHPLPPDFTVAVRLVGDATCLEPLARAWMQTSASRAGRDRTWPGDVRETFKELFSREGAASRRRLLARLRKRWQGDSTRLDELVGTGRRT